jgi:hypothetical protein
MSKVEFNIGDWRKKFVLSEGVGGVITRNPFSKIPGLFRTEAVDYIDDTEADQDYDELEDKDLDNDGDQDASDSYLHTKQSKVADVTEGTGFSTWTIQFTPQEISGVKLGAKSYSVSARTTVEAIRKAASMAGLKGNDWMAATVLKLIKSK